jgi:hypothetical protein
MNTGALQSLQQKQTFLRILIFSFTTVLIWVAFSLLLSQQRTGISEALQTLAKPLNPNIHIEVVDQIQQKRAFSQGELQNFPILRVIHNVNGTESVITTQQIPSPVPSPFILPSPVPAP